MHYYYQCFVAFVLHLYHSHLSHLTPYLFQIFITTFNMEDQRGIITIDIISLIISMIITEERGKTIDNIFIDAKQYGGRKDVLCLSPPGLSTRNSSPTSSSSLSLTHLIPFLPTPL